MTGGAPPHPPRASGMTRSAGWAGFAAGAAALAVALVLRLVTGIPSIAELIGESVTYVLPVPVFDALLGIFGPAAKPLLVVAVAIGALAAAAALGILSARIGRTRQRASLIGLLGALAGASGLPLLLGAPATALIGLPAAALYAWRFWAGWDGPSFIAAGARDPVLGVPAMERLHRIVRGSPPPLVLPDAGHFVQERGDVVARAALAAFGRAARD